MKHLSLLLLALLLVRGYAADRPNVVWIVSEDNSIHYLRHFFPGGAEAPNIEAMAAHGITFDRAYSCSPVCSVARTTLATSCYGPRIGTQFHRKYRTAEMPAGQKMFSAHLRDAGYYATNNSKTDYNVSGGKEAWDESSKKAGWRNRPDPKQPFFHMESHGASHESSLHFGREVFENAKTAHDPAEVTLADYHPDTPIFRYTHARYLDRIQTIDGLVGATLGKLREDGLLEDTFVFYFGDHGGVLPRGKGYIHESGLHVPLVVRVPENFKHLAEGRAFGARARGTVSFVDFGPTALRLAGAEAPAGIDGRAFLGQGVAAEEVDGRDEVFGYADRFDEKYEFVRTVVSGDYQYIRWYQPFLPGGLQNNYRYRMLAFQEWRELWRAGKLDGTRSQFFRAKPAESLFHIVDDPHEVRDLAGDPAHAEALQRLRGMLGRRVRTMPDLSFYPESRLVEIMDDPAGFGQKQKAEIAELADIADLALRPFAEARPGLETALGSDNPWHRYWGAMACSAFGEAAKPLAPAVAELLDDEPLVLRVRAAEFLGLVNERDPQPILAGVVNETASAVEATEALNSVVYFRDNHEPPYAVDPAALRPRVGGDGVKRRLEYLRGGSGVRANPKRKRKP